MDPTAAVNLVFSGIRAAAAVGRFMEQREERKILQTRHTASIVSRPTASLTAEERAIRSDAFRRDVLVVLGVLGEKLLNLGVVNEPWLPIAREEALRCVRLKGGEYRAMFEEEMEPDMQWAVTAAMFLCAGCWPMPIYRGFGACVLNEWLWAVPDPNCPRDNDPETTQMDDCIALLKTASQGHDVLRGYPKGLNRMTPSCAKKERAPEVIWYLDAKTSQYKKRGMPRPRDGSFKVTEVIWPWSTYDSDFALQNRFTYDFSNLSPILRWQQDAGRMIYGFTVGGFLDLQPGQMLEPTSEIATAILWWLYGLKGTTFRIVPQSGLDINHWKLKKKYQKQWDDEQGAAIYAVRDEALIQQRDALRLAMAQSLPLPPTPISSPNGPVSIERGFSLTRSGASRRLSTPKPEPPATVPTSLPSPAPSGASQGVPLPAYNWDSASATPQGSFTEPPEGYSYGYATPTPGPENCRAIPAAYGPQAAAPDAGPSSPSQLYAASPAGWNAQSPPPQTEYGTQPWNYPPQHPQQTQNAGLPSAPATPLTPPGPVTSPGVSPCPGSRPQHVQQPRDVAGLSGSMGSMTMDGRTALPEPYARAPTPTSRLAALFEPLQPPTPSYNYQPAQPVVMGHPATAQQAQAWPPAPAPAPHGVTGPGAAGHWQAAQHDVVADPPPAYSLRKVEAQFDFTARREGELSFRKGETLEILRDSNGDGWLLARKQGIEGKVPEAYVTSF